MTAPLVISGIRLGTTCAGIKYPQRRDLVIIEVAIESTAAAVFTQNAFCAAPVMLSKQHVAATSPRYLVINTGNANAGTGALGMLNAQRTCDALAHLTGCQPDQVLPFSTGVIGEPLPVEKIVAGLPQALAVLQEDGWEEAARGIMTTDTRPKWASQRINIGTQAVTVTGIAKGAGMICPNMATLLSFIATDALVAPHLLQSILQSAVADTFNAITIDGDTSTNDSCVLLATGRSGVMIPSVGAEYTAFASAIQAVCAELAQAIVRDGEGATKYIAVQVEGGYDVAECRQVAYTIAHSPLVKTAFFASDPNWGRVLAAIGRAGLADLAIEQVTVDINDVPIVRSGGRAEAYTEAQGQAAMQPSDITVRVGLGRGMAAATVLTTDFSFDYVRINAEYRT